MMYYRKIVILLIFGTMSAQDIAFVGDSITKSGYSVLIGDALPSHTTHNFGIGGITVANGNNNYRNTAEFQQVLDLETQHTIVMLGSNDVRFYKTLYEVWGSLWVYEYKWLIVQFEKNSKVLLCTIPYQLNANDTFPTIDRINEKIYDIGKEFRLEVVDINSALGKNANYFREDGVHPNADGIQIMAKKVLKHLTSEYLDSDYEYWGSVNDYEEQKRIGWFGCQH